MTGGAREPRWDRQVTWTGVRACAGRGAAPHRRSRPSARITLVRCPRDRLDLWAVPNRRPHRSTKSSRCTPSGTRDYMRRPPSRFGGQKDAGGPGPPAAQVPPCFDVYRRRSCSPPRSIITAATLRQTATPHTSVNNEIHMASLSDFLRPPLERRKQLPKGGSVPSLGG